MKKNKYKLLMWLSFFFPEVALFQYIMQDDKKSEKSQAILSGLNLFIGLAIVSLILYVILIVLPMILYMFNS